MPSNNGMVRSLATPFIPGVMRTLVAGSMLMIDARACLILAVLTLGNARVFALGERLDQP
jgi:hypothetical protein